jgi:hypothetical protein
MHSGRVCNAHRLAYVLGAPWLPCVVLGACFRSGPTAYINDKVAYPLAYDAITAASGDMDSTKVDEHSWNEYFAGQHWAQPSVTHLRQLMRRVSCWVL